ncbi:hypothetical protein ACP275_10G052300 [Erythranthe tilingii]
MISSASIIEQYSELTNSKIDEFFFCFLLIKLGDGRRCLCLCLIFFLSIKFWVDAVFIAHQFTCWFRVPLRATYLKMAQNGEAEIENGFSNGHVTNDINSAPLGGRTDALAIRVDPPTQFYTPNQTLVGHFPDFIAYRLRDDRDRVQILRNQSEEVITEQNEIITSLESRLDELETEIQKQNIHIGELQVERAEQQTMLNQQQHEIESISRDLEVANQQNVQLRRALARIVRHFTDQFVQMRHSMRALTQRAWSAAQRGYVLASRSLGSDHRHLIESGTSTAANQANQTFGYRAAATDSEEDPEENIPNGVGSP